MSRMRTTSTSQNSPLIASSTPETGAIKREYVSDDYQLEVASVGVESSHSIVRQLEGKCSGERFISNLEHKALGGQTCWMN